MRREGIYLVRLEDLFWRATCLILLGSKDAAGPLSMTSKSSKTSETPSPTQLRQSTLTAMISLSCAGTCGIPRRFHLRAGLTRRRQENSTSEQSSFLQNYFIPIYSDGSRECRGRICSWLVDQRRSHSPTCSDLVLQRVSFAPFAEGP